GSRAAEGVVQSAAEAKGSWKQTQESASELFVPDAQVSIRGGIGGVVVREPAVTVIKSVAGIIDRAAGLCVGAISDVAGIGEAIAEDNDLGKGGGRDWSGSWCWCWCGCWCRGWSCRRSCRGCRCRRGR